MEIIVVIIRKDYMDWMCMRDYIVFFLPTLLAFTNSLNNYSINHTNAHKDSTK